MLIPTFIFGFFYKKKKISDIGGIDYNPLETGSLGPGMKET
jgi:hypothetical protein